MLTFSVRCWPTSSTRAQIFCLRTWGRDTRVWFLRHVDRWADLPFTPTQIAPLSLPPHDLFQTLCPLRPADKVVVGAVRPGEDLLLLHHRVPAGAAQPHSVQHLQAAQGHGRFRRGQLHRVPHPAGRDMWVLHVCLTPRSEAVAAIASARGWKQKSCCCNRAVQTVEEVNTEDYWCLPMLTLIKEKNNSSAVRIRMKFRFSAALVFNKRFQFPCFSFFKVWAYFAAS